MLPDLQLLGWSGIQIMVGIISSGRTNWDQIHLNWQPGDIRNCSYAQNVDWIGITAEDRTHGQEVLGVYQRQINISEILIRQECLLHHALNQNGTKICYTQPSKLAGKADLYLYTRKGGHTHCIEEGVAAQNSHLYWMDESRKIVFHSTDGQIFIWDLILGKQKSLITGQMPAVSQNGNKIAFQKENQLYIWNTIEKKKDRLKIPRSWYKQDLTNGLSWSADGRFLSYGLTGGLTDKSNSFYLADITTGQHQQINAPQLRGLLIMS